MAFDPKLILEGIEVEHIRVLRMTQCVLYGLVEPSDVDMTPDFNHRMAETIVDELHTTMMISPSMFMSRAKRAFQWAMRDSVEPDFAIFMGERLRSLIAICVDLAPDAKDIFKTPEYRAYAKKFKPVLDSVRSAIAARGRVRA